MNQSNCKYWENTTVDMLSENSDTALLLKRFSWRSAAAAAAAAKSLQLCPTLCDPRDSSRPRCPIPGILQARTLEWVAISFSSAWKWKVKVNSISHVRLWATPWTAAYQAPPSMGFSRQEFCSGMSSPSQGGLVCCNSWGCKESDTTEQLNWTDWNLYDAHFPLNNH